MSNRATQLDIARIAGVSQATVSRALSGDPNVEPELRDRVLEAVKAQNYRPDSRARSLRSKRTGLIGLVVKRPQGGLSGDPFFASLVSGIMEYLSEKPYHLCTDMVTSDMRQGAVYDELLRTRRVDGLILVEPHAEDERIYRLQSDNFPFVLIGNAGAGNSLWSVDNDNLVAGTLATKHMIDSGFERIAMLGGPKGLAVSEDRISGYRKALCETQQKPTVWHSDFGIESARSVALEILSRPDRPDALVVLDDLMAMGVIQAARRLRLHIPDDLGLVSFNDSSLCEMLDGGLSSISLNMKDLVRTSCDKLLSVIEDRRENLEKRSIVRCHLHERGSSLRQSRVRS